MQRLYFSRKTELQRFRRLFRRLAWKANSLTHWSHRALNLAQEYQVQAHAQAQQHPANTTTTVHGHPDVQGHTSDHHFGPRACLGRYEMVIHPIEAERQFKIDFYEFYALLERGLVCLLGVWGIVISSSVADYSTPAAQSRDSGPGSGPVPAPSSHAPHSNSHSALPATNAHEPKSKSNTGSGSIIGDSRGFHASSTHRFHANVLSALDHPSNPLHDVLGQGDARAYIGVAKEFRNKWKDVEQRPDDSFRGAERHEEEWDSGKVRRYEKVLADLQLEELLGAVLAALEDAGRRAEREVSRLENLLELSATADRTTISGTSSKGTSAGATSVVDVDFDMEDAPFEALDERDEDDYAMEF